VPLPHNRGMPPGALVARVGNVSTAVRWALAFLGCTAPLAPKPAVIFDIDGTLINNNTNGNPKCVCAFRNMVRACASYSIAIFVVTARPDEPRNRQWTERQLASCAIEPVEQLFMRPEDADFAKCKYEAREQIRAQGFQVLLSIGDQWADCALDEHRDLSDKSTYIGTLGDDGSFAIKLMSEFA
jgi:hypothetical protein